MQASPPPPTRSSRGKLVVVLMLAVGVIAGIVSVTWWTVNLEIDRQLKAETAADPAKVAQAYVRLEEQVHRALQSGGITHALRDEIQAFVDRHPDFPDGHRLLGQTLVLAGDRQAGYRHWLRSLELDPRQPELLLNAGALANDAGDLEAAHRHFRDAVSIDPANARYLLSLGSIQIKMQRYDEANITLLKALEHDSTLDQAYSALADLYKRQNKLVLAMTQIDKAIDLAQRHDKGERVVHYTLAKAQLLRSDNQPEQALLLLRGLSVLDRLKPEVIESMAQCWAQQGQPDKAAELWEAQAAARPNVWQYFAGAARWRIKAGDMAIARRHIDDVRRINPRASEINELTALLK